MRNSEKFAEWMGFNFIVFGGGLQMVLMTLMFIRKTELKLLDIFSMLMAMNISMIGGLLVLHAIRLRLVKMDNPSETE